MRKTVVLAAIAAATITPFMANATILPSATTLQSTADGPVPAPLHVKKHAEFLPVAFLGLAAAGTGVAYAVRGNSPS
jgi:hypothetical protein